MRYLIEILIVDLPIEIILSELKTKKSHPHHLALIENNNPQKLAEKLLTSEYGLNFLKIICLNQP